MSDTSASSSHRQEFLLRRIVTAEDKAQWEKWAQEKAQAAFDKAQELFKAGMPRNETVRWFERAARLAPSSPNVLFTLAMEYIALQDYASARRTLENLNKLFSFGEGKVIHVLACLQLGRWEEARELMAAYLSSYVMEGNIGEMADQIVSHFQLPGWCALDSQGNVIFHSVFSEDIDIKINHHPAYRTELNVYEESDRIKRVDISYRGQALLGSPLLVEDSTRCEGFVTSEGGEYIEGWAWYPANPQRLPNIILEKQQKNGHFKAVTSPVKLSEYAGKTDQFLVFSQPRRFCFPLAGYGEGTFRVVTDKGEVLAGSPLQPSLAQQSQKMAYKLSSGKNLTLPEQRLLKAFFPQHIPVDLWKRNIFLQETSTKEKKTSPLRPIAIVIPVYKGIDEVKACLDSVLKTLNASSNTIVQIIDDASPDPEMRTMLESFSRQANVYVSRNEQNRGFPYSANKGIAAWPDHDIILLNSDTLVTGHWATILQTIAYKHSHIATVTPLSNRASIFSYPSAGGRNADMDLQQTKKMMSAAFKANKDHFVQVPTAHGFCMYIRRKCLDDTGLLREDIFAQGYGEENDFCLRASQAGWIHVAATGVFVAHQEGVSFKAARQALLDRNLRILNQLHIGYDKSILAFQEEDPLFEDRRKIDLIRWNEIRKKEHISVADTVLIITHDEGGGVEKAVQERAQLLRRAGKRVVFLRPDIKGFRLSLGESFRPDLGHIEKLETFPNLLFIFEEKEKVWDLLRKENISYVEWHHSLGHDSVIQSLCADLHLNYHVYIHDFIWYCPRIALVSLDRVYCNEPDVKECQACIARLGNLIPHSLPLLPMLERSAQLLAGAIKIIAPSRDTAQRVRKRFSAYNLTIDVEPLEQDFPNLSLEQMAHVSTPSLLMQKHDVPLQKGYKRICLLGGIGIEKGFDILLDLARDAQHRNLLLEYVVIGHTIDDESLHATGKVFVTGPYKEEEVIALIKSQQAMCAFFPAVWPETWSYTLALAWRAGLKAVVFDLGAPAERVQDTGRGHLVKLPHSQNEIQKINDMFLNYIN